MKNGHSEDDTFHTLVKLKILRVIFTMKVLPWNWLKWRGNSVPKEFCSYFSHPFHIIFSGPADIVLETRAKNCSEPFCQRSLKRKGLDVTFRQHGLKCNVQEHHFVYFYEVIINCYPNFMTCFYFPLRSNSSHSQVIDLLKSKESFKGKVHSDNNWKTEWF